MNFDTTCRTCWSEARVLHNIYERPQHAFPNGCGTSVLTLAEKLCILTEMRITEGDGLPSNICTSCRHKLDSSYAFRLNCKQVDANMRKFLVEAMGSGAAGWFAMKANEMKLAAASMDCLERSNRPTLLLGNFGITRAATTACTSVGLPGQGVQLQVTGSVTSELRADFLGMSSRGCESAAKGFQCSKCKKHYETIEDLSKHKKDEHNYKYQCIACPKVFATNRYLKIHNRAHTGEFPYLCEWCPARFRDPQGFNIHVRRHSGRKDYHCAHCSMSFVLKFDLKAHERTHTGEKPFACQFCSKRFANTKLRDSHHRIHTGETPYSCQSCEKPFKHYCNLYVHKKICPKRPS